MKSKYIISIVTLISILLIILSNIAFAQLVVQDNQALELACDAQITETKTFIASSQEINTGLWCDDNAQLKLYECHSATCSKKALLLSANKVGGKLATITGYQVGTKYNYECLECPVAPTLKVQYETLSIKEGQRLQMSGSCIDSKGRIGSIEYKGWMKSSIRQTDFQDAGEYSVKVVCTDQNKLTTTKELIVSVQDVNRAPTVHAVLKQ